MQPEERQWVIDARLWAGDAKSSSAEAVALLQRLLQRNSRVRLIQAKGGMWYTDLVGVMPVPSWQMIAAGTGQGIWNNDTDDKGQPIPQQWPDELFNSMIRYDQRTANVAFLRDPRDKSVWLVWGMMWRRKIIDERLLPTLKWYWGTAGADTTEREWDPIHLDAIPRADALGALPVPDPTAQPPGLPAGPVIDVEGSLKVATPSQLAALGAATLIAALNEVFTQHPKPVVVPPQPSADEPTQPAASAPEG